MPPVVDEEVTDANIFEFVTLGQYIGIEFDRVPIIPVTDGEVYAWIDEHMGQVTETVSVTDRAVMNGDIVNIDFEGLRDGVAFAGGTDHGVDLEIGSGRFIPGFEEQIIGHYIGDEFDIYIEFPEDYFEPSLAGVQVVFRIKLHGITAEEVLELTDELVQEHLGLASVEEYRALIREQKESERETAAIGAEKSQVWNQIIDNATVHKLPAQEIEFRIERAMMEFSWYAMIYGLDLEDLIDQVTGMTLDEFTDSEVRPGAMSDVKHDLVLRAVAAQEGIALTEAEFNEQVARLIEDLGFDDEEHFFEVNGEDAVRIALLADKVIEFLMEHAAER
jgi:trigger factor